MVMGNRAREINIILKQIEIESEKYNLKLNHDKCFYIGMNGTANIHFKDGKKIEKADKMTYLGGTITPNASRNAEISSRMSKALATCQKLKIFWQKTDAPIAWKIQVYNAVIISQLVYGLNSLNITPSIKGRLNAFHMRGLRKMLNIEHSYYSHITNEEVIERANICLNKAESLDITWQQFMIDKEFKDEIKYIKLVGDIIEERQLSLLGHVIRREPSELIRRVALDENLNRPQQLYKRTGAPRQNWAEDNLQRAHEKFFAPNERYDKNNPEHVKQFERKSKELLFLSVVFSILK